MELCYQEKYKSGTCDSLKIRTKLQLNFIRIIIFLLLFLNALKCIGDKHSHKISIKNFESHFCDKRSQLGEIVTNMRVATRDGHF